MEDLYQSVRFNAVGQPLEERRKRRFQFTIGGLLTVTTLLASVLGIGRWVYVAKPWVKPGRGLAVVACCETDARSLVLEYRMREPFEVVLVHRLQDPRRSEAAATIPSEYEVLRGHFVRFRVSKEPQVAVKANNKTVWISPWSVADASKTKWTAPREGASFGVGIGHSVVELAVSKDSREVIELFVSTAREERNIDRQFPPLTDWSFGEGRGQ